jgi:hypothetical protein
LSFVFLVVFVSSWPSSAAANVVSVTLNPPTITGGTGASTIGTVAIGQPAPAGGRVINLASSNTDLAASTERVVVPAGATTATFTVGTNALYRAYSGLAFNVTITATDPADGGAASAVLHVTPQAIPGPFSGSTVSTDARATAGRMCGGSFGTGDAKERGILYSCNFPQAGQFSVCRFQQECSFGCQTQSAPSLNRQDVCRTAPPFPIAVVRQLGGGFVAGERHSPGRGHHRQLYDRDRGGHDCHIRHLHRHAWLKLADGGLDRVVSAADSDIDVDGDGDRPDRLAHHLNPGRDQRRRRQHRLGVVHDRNLDHAEGLERARGDLVGRLLERRQQAQDVHVHSVGQRVGDRQREVRDGDQKPVSSSCYFVSSRLRGLRLTGAREEARSST